MLLSSPKQQPLAEDLDWIQECNLTCGRLSDMLRVTKAEPWERTIITIEGKVSSDYVELIETSCHEAQSSGKQVYLLLRDVGDIDEAGRAMLRRLAAKGVQLVGKGVYTCFLVRALRPAGTQVSATSVNNPKSDSGPTEQEL